MKHFILFAVGAFFLSNCNKVTSQTEKPASKISVKKNNTDWKTDGVQTSYGIDDDKFYVSTAKENETFTIIFKKGSIPSDGILKDFASVVIIAPAKGSAAISDRYTLDPTKPNKIKLLIQDNAENRIVGDFILYLKRDKQYTSAGEATNIYRGRFDVHYKSVSLKDSLEAKTFLKVI